MNTGMSGSTASSFASIGNKLFAATGSNGIYFSTNGGASWLPVAQGSTPSYVTTLFIVQSNLFAGTQSGVYLSTNAGDTWTAANTNLIRNISSFAIEDNQLFAATSDDTGVWRRPLAEMITLGVTQSASSESSLSAYPNPFERSVTINLDIAERSAAKVVIVNALGIPVAELFNGTLEAGGRSFIWDAHDVPPGNYWCELRTSGSVERTAIVLDR